MCRLNAGECLLMTPGCASLRRCQNATNSTGNQETDRLPVLAHDERRIAGPLMTEMQAGAQPRDNGRRYAAGHAEPVRGDENRAVTEFLVGHVPPDPPRICHVVGDGDHDDHQRDHQWSQRFRNSQCRSLSRPSAGVCFQTVAAALLENMQRPVNDGLAPVRKSQQNRQI